jgi:hypothetical protein
MAPEILYRVCKISPLDPTGNQLSLVHTPLSKILPSTLTHWTFWSRGWVQVAPRQPADRQVRFRGVIPKVSRFRLHNFQFTIPTLDAIRSELLTASSDPPSRFPLPSSAFRPTRYIHIFSRKNLFNKHQRNQMGLRGRAWAIHKTMHFR